MKKYLLGTIIILGLASAWAYSALASDSGALSPGTMADDATVGTVAWTNPNNAMASDNVYATCALNGTTGVSHYLKATNFGFAIPAGATINGILAEFEKKKSGANANGYDVTVKIVKADGTFGTTNKADTVTAWSSTDTYVSVPVSGASTDLWGETWTPADINDVDFGVALSGKMVNISLNENSLISTPNGLVKIKNIKVGDTVFSYNETTKKTELKIVEIVTSHPISEAHSRYFYIYSNGQIVKATESHSFFVNGSYIRADELKVGDKLLGFDLKEHPIENIEIIGNNTDIVWDLEVEGNHNFFANDILVHNIGGGTLSVDHIRITVYYTLAVAASQTMVANVITFE